MSTVLVTTPGAQLSARDGQLVIEVGEAVTRVPLGHVKELLVQGNARLSTALLRDLIRHGASVHLLDGHGHVEGSLHAPWRGGVDLVERQFTLPEATALGLARAIVRAKVRNGRWALRRVGTPAELPTPGLDHAVDLNTLRGVEGAAARSYFGRLGETLDPAWGFVGRRYRPCPDPMNATLSYLYTLLLARVSRAVAAVGLHPCRGVLHVSHGTRPALALDLMEAFRAPVCDTLAVALLRSGRLPRSGFEEHAAEGVRLGRAGCAVAATAFVERAERWALDATISREVRAFAAALGGATFEGWAPPTQA